MRIAKDAACHYRCSVVCLSVCLYVCLLFTSVNCDKMDEPMEVPFGLWTRGAQRTIY